MRDFVDVYRNAAFINTTGPLRVLSGRNCQSLQPKWPVLVEAHQSSRRFILMDVYLLVKIIEMILFAPVLRILELTKRVAGNEFAGAEIATGLREKSATSEV